MTDHPCGCIGLITISCAANRAADFIAVEGKPLAVCLAPNGAVTVEEVEQAIPDDIAGVYIGDSVFRLWGMIEGDLVASMKDRRIMARRAA